jgi:Flp pilus assembly pilin Flp
MATMMNQVTAAARTSLSQRKSRKGQSLLEYALVLAFISVLTITYMNGLGTQIRGLFFSVIDALSAAGHGF